jgi:hypothetical protein
MGRIGNQPYVGQGCLFAETHGLGKLVNEGRQVALDEDIAIDQEKGGLIAPRLCGCNAAGGLKRTGGLAADSNSQAPGASVLKKLLDLIGQVGSIDHDFLPVLHLGESQQVPLNQRPVGDSKHGLGRLIG